ncbi:unnamed protein product, partial [Prorocentrum cordatum]
GEKHKHKEKKRSKEDLEVEALKKQKSTDVAAAEKAKEKEKKDKEKKKDKDRDRAKKDAPTKEQPAPEAAAADQAASKKTPGSAQAPEEPPEKKLKAWQDDELEVDEDAQEAGSKLRALSSVAQRSSGPAASSGARCPEGSWSEARREVGRAARAARGL